MKPWGKKGIDQNCYLEVILKLCDGVKDVFDVLTMVLQNKIAEQALLPPHSVYETFVIHDYLFSK